ncbi:MAG: signal peptidase II [Actinobacteria bacterium]|nr:MAG: signal peptidase II [Actinomycetota bacterium]
MACLWCRGSRSPRSVSAPSRGRLSEWRRRWAGWAPPHGDVTGRRGRLVLALGIAAAVILVDQLTKWWAVVNLQDRIIHLFWTFQLNLTFNSGMAFGRGRGFGPLIAVVGIVLVTVLLLGTSRAPTKLAAVAGGLVLGGAISNLLDRIFRNGDGFLGGHVVDFIDPQWYPVWNVADAAVVIGGILLVVIGVRSAPTEAVSKPS